MSSADEFNLHRSYLRGHADELALESYAGYQIDRARGLVLVNLASEPVEFSFVTPYHLVEIMGHDRYHSSRERRLLAAYDPECEAVVMFLHSDASGMTTYLMRPKRIWHTPLALYRAACAAEAKSASLASQFFGGRQVQVKP